MSILIIDYGMSNLGSITRAIELCGIDSLVSDDPSDIKNASKLVLPGVGSFADGIGNLLKLGWINPIKSAVINDNIPFLGICLGMQLLADKGYEAGDNDGLGLIPGEVKKLGPCISSERIPHIGWNEVSLKTNESKLFANIPDNSDFYFVHSYAFNPTNDSSVIATTPYCQNFVSAVAKGNIFGVQFHPEKSGELGLRLLKNFANLQGLDTC